MSDSVFRPGSDEEWEALMRQVRLRPQAQPQPFFYARVQARLLAQADTTPVWLPAWVRRPAYAAVLGAMVLAISGDGATAANGEHHRHSNGYPAHQLPR